MCVLGQPSWTNSCDHSYQAFEEEESQTETSFTPCFSVSKFTLKVSLEEFIEHFSSFPKLLWKKLHWRFFVDRGVPGGIYLFKVNKGNTRTIYEINSKLTTNAPERRQWHCSYVFIVNFEQILHIILMFPLLTLYK